MPPLSHGTPEHQANSELKESITQLERSIRINANALVLDARHTEYSNLSGLKAALHHRKPVSTIDVRYETVEHFGDYGVRDMLTDYGSKKKDTISLLTKVVRDIKSPSEDDTIIGEGTIGLWVERVRISGSIYSGYDMTICDVNSQLITPQEHLCQLENIKDTVDLISMEQYSKKLEEQR